MNQLMTFLDKNNVKDTLSGRSDTALRSVRAKREAEEAGGLSPNITASSTDSVA